LAGNIWNNIRNTNRRIIAVGGGKGGVGKSVIAANLAVALASLGNRSVLVDMDFGSANLHTFLGKKAPALSIKDFLLKKEGSLSDILIDTGIKNLKFISGAGDMPGVANLKFYQKCKIIRHLKALEGDFIILDLSPGITFNVLDFLSIADMSILITTPEVTSVTNTFSFMKAVIFRELSKVFKHNNVIEGLLNKAKDSRNEDGIRTVAQLEAGISGIDAEQADKLRLVINSHKVKFILNMVRREEELSAAHLLRSLVEEYLSVQFECLGLLDYEELVQDSIFKMRPFMLEYPQSNAAQYLRDIALKLTDTFAEHDAPILKSDEEISKKEEVYEDLNIHPFKLERPESYTSLLMDIASRLAGTRYEHNMPAQTDGAEIPQKEEMDTEKEDINTEEEEVGSEEEEVKTEEEKSDTKIKTSEPGIKAKRWGNYVSSDRPKTREKEAW